MYLGAASGTTVSHVSDIVGPVSSFTALNILDKCIVIMILLIFEFQGNYMSFLMLLCRQELFMLLNFHIEVVGTL